MCESYQNYTHIHRDTHRRTHIAQNEITSKDPIVQASHLSRVNSCIINLVMTISVMLTAGINKLTGQESSSSL